MKARQRWLPTDERWFRWGCFWHLAVFLILAHVYDVAVFQDVSWRMAAGDGIYAPFADWLQQYGDGYYAYPPLYAYMLWISGRLASLLGGHWWVHQILIKGWLLLADILVFRFMWFLNPGAARTYWSLWFVPVVAIGQTQPDLWVGIAVLAAFWFVGRGRWVLSGLALAFGVVLKITPVVITPFVLIHVVANHGWRAAGRLLLALAVGSAALILPYVFFYRDAFEFTQVLAFHLDRPASGLSILAGARLLSEAIAVIRVFAGWETSSEHVLERFFLRATEGYYIAGALVFVMLAFLGNVHRWTRAQVFALPLLTFFLVNKVVHEQYLFVVLPLLLVAMPSAVTRLRRPYSIYVLAAGSPLRFLPPQYGLPATLDALVPPQFQVSLAPPVMIALSILSAGSAIWFGMVLYQVIRGGLEGVKSVHPQPVQFKAEDRTAA